VTKHTIGELLKRVSEKSTTTEKMPRFDIGTGVDGFTGAARVRVMAKDESGKELVIYMDPDEAQRIGVGMIEAAHASVIDSAIFGILKEEGKSVDEIGAFLRKIGKIMVDKGHI
jgi:hypothetical protein